MFEQILNFIRPPDDATPKALNRWRWNVMLSVLAIVAFASWTVTPYGFALASEVDKKIAAAVAPLQKDLTDVKLTQTAQGQLLERVAASLNEQLANSKAAEIRLLVLKRCTALPGSTERDSLNREMETKQAEYKALRGERYQAPSCSEL